MPIAARQTLAFIEGFRRPPAGQAHGTHQAAYLICEALAQAGRHAAFHLYQDRARNPGLYGDVVLPRTPPTTTFEKSRLHLARDGYAAIYVCNGEQILCAPHVLRPKTDWAPVICSIGTTHANSQWSYLFLSLASGAVRATDGLIFKSRSARDLFRKTWTEWSDRFGFASEFPAMTTVVPNGVDIGVNRRSDVARREMRSRLRIDDQDVVYLAFSRLDPGTKGDLESVIVRWKEVVAQVPRALLLLTGVAVDRWFVTELRQLARAAGVGDRVLVVDNPSDLTPDARGGLMSAADAFVHLSTGVEETSSLAVHEALAHALPVIATSWAGMPEMVVPGETGYLIETRGVPLGARIAATLFGHTDRTHLVHASRAVFCDFRAFVAAAVALADDDRRLSMGAAARRREEAQDVAAIAGRFVEFFDATAAAAEKAWTGPVPWRPLVDLNAVIAAQATRPLEADVLVRVGDRGRLELVSQGFYPEAEAQLARVMDCFRDRDAVTVADLAAAAAIDRLTAPPSEIEGDDDLATSGRLLIRLLHHGVLELADAVQPPSDAIPGD